MRDGSSACDFPSVYNSPVPTLPTISIAVPVFNSAATLHRTLQSLVDQQYPGLEILIADGGSTDGSVDIIRSFEPYLTWWCSEQDRGQCHAINKALAHATGEICNWLGSDDYLLPGALMTVGKYAAAHPDVDVISGQCEVQFFHDPSRNRVWLPELDRIELMPCCLPLCQQATFFRRSLVNREPPLDEAFHFALDTELFNYFKSKGAKFAAVDELLAVYCMTGENKTSQLSQDAVDELERVYRRYVTNERISLMFWHRRVRFPLERLIRKSKPGAVRSISRLHLAVLDALLSPVYGRRRVNALSWKRYA